MIWHGCVFSRRIWLFALLPNVKLFQHLGPALFCEKGGGKGRGRNGKDEDSWWFSWKSFSNHCYTFHSRFFPGVFGDDGMSWTNIPKSEKSENVSRLLKHRHPVAISCGRFPTYPARDSQRSQRRTKDCKSATNKPHADLGWVFEGGAACFRAETSHPGMIGLDRIFLALETDISAENWWLEDKMVPFHGTFVHVRRGYKWWSWCHAGQQLGSGQFGKEFDAVAFDLEAWGEVVGSPDGCCLDNKFASYVAPRKTVHTAKWNKTSCAIYLLLRGDGVLFCRFCNNSSSCLSRTHQCHFVQGYANCQHVIF